MPTQAAAGPAASTSVPMRTTTSSSSSTTATKTSSATSAPSSQSLKRAPSLSEITASIQSHPEKWERVRKMSIAAAEASLPTVVASSVPMGISKSLDPASMSNGGTAGLSPQLQSASMTHSGSTSSDVSVTSAGDSAASNSSAEGPRLRLTARLAAAAAPAPLLSRSQSTNSIVFGNDGNSISSTSINANGTGLTGRSSSFVTSPTATNNEGQELPGSSLPALSSLQSTLARRSSVSTSSSSNATSTSTGQSLPSRGLPSLDAIKQRYAQKKQKEKDTSSSSSSQVAGQAGHNELKSTQPGASIAITTAASAGSSEASKENVDPKTGIDVASTSSIANTSGNSSVAMSKSSSSASSSLSGASSSSPTTPTDVSMPLSDKSINKGDHPLEHKWTMYYDSRTTAKAAAMTKPATPTSVGHPNGSTITGQSQYEAGLATLASVNTVESFCRLYNWLKKPGKLGMSENLHFFKDDIRPMWEDEHNKNGGKWTVSLDMKVMNSREMVDRLWMYLCFALIGEDFEEKNDLICGAVISIRPRVYRFQIWINEKEDIASVNAIGKNLIRILELQNPSTGARIPGLSLEFSAHSKTGPPPQKFLHLPPMAIPAPSSAFQAPPGALNLQPPRGLTPSGSTSSLSSLARPPGFGGAGSAFGTGIGLSRAVSMNAIASKLDNPSGNGTMNWRERLNQPSKKSSLAA